ncbi:MAG: hypothetical protein H7061_04840 [Bdellovibrionaceae bacterium]|nr:hypothetical protein [Bdellovibrio sp.]
MKIFICVLFSLLTINSQASQFKAGIFPALNYNGELTGVFRIDTVVLLGKDFFSVGPYVGIHAQTPQVSDTIYGAAIHIGHAYYFEIQGGVLNRTFTQDRTQKLTGSGMAGNLIFGINLSPSIGIDVVFSTKRISEGSLDKRWIYQLLPIFTLKGEF